MASNISYNSYYGYYSLTSWRNASTNNNIIYSGKSSDGNTYRSRIVLNTSNMVISSSSKLVVKITVAQQDSQYYGNTVARLSTYNLTKPGEYFKDDGYTPIDDITNNTISSSNFYTDSNGSTLATSYQSEGNILYLIFDTKNKIYTNQTYYIYIGREGTSSSRFNAFKASEIQLTYIGYTSCVAPSTITASGIITPNGSFTVSWSGASPGNGQTISGYDIYYIISNTKDTVPSTTSFTGTTSISSSSNSGSTTFTINAEERQRGYWIKCGVVTKGSAGPQYYSSIGTEGSNNLITINELPSPPSSITISRDIVPSTGGTVTFTPKYISSEEGQTNSIWYSSSSTGTKTKMTGDSISLNINNNMKTYYFWTYDGLEYSSSNLSQTISINTKPTCSITLSGNPVASNWTDTNSNSNTPYIITPTLTINNGNDGQNNNKYNLWIQYSDSEDFSSYTEKLIKSNYTSTEYAIVNIRKELSNKKPPYYYRTAVIRNDGLEDSDKVFSSQIYYVNSVPKITSIFNNENYQNIEGLEDIFDKVLGFYFEYDSSYFSFTLDSGKRITLSSDNTNKLTYGQIDDAGYSNSGYTTISGNYDDNSNFTYIHKDSEGNDYKIYKVEKFNINNLNIDIFIPWTLTEGRFSIQNIFGEWAVSEDTLKNFGITSVDECFKYALESQNNINISPNFLSNEATLYFTPIWDMSGLDSDTDYIKTVTFQFINKFGTISEGSSTLYIKYKVVPTITEFSCNQLSTAQLKEGNVLSFNLKATNCYNSSQKAEIYTIINGAERSLSVWALSSPEGKVNQTLTYNLEEIKNEEKITAFKVKITNNAGTTAEQILTGQFIILLKHTTPNVSLIRTDYQTEGTYGKVTIYFNPNNWGLESLFNTDNNTINLTLYKINGEELATTINSEIPVDKNTSYYTFTLTNALGEEGWETANVYLKVSVTNNTNSIETTYTQTATNSVIVYNLTPTIAYRKNYLGINTKNPDLDASAIMIIGNASGRDKIIYTTADNTHPVCVLVNFKIDCGSWDENLTS